MTASEIVRLRLVNQQIAHTKIKKPEKIVHWMVAMQAQEYAFAKWAIGLRLPGSTDALIEEAFNRGKILRTHLLRPTWHFVSPEDIRWLISLSAPRVNAALASYNKKLELDSKTFKKSNDILVKILQGGKFLTRNAIRPAFENAKIKTDTIRMAHLLFDAELKGIICSGPKEGKQFTYGLLEERVPPAKQLSHDEALTELAMRYFESRGPATVHDFSWWSGLSVTDARKGVSFISSKLEREQVEDREYLFVNKRINNTSEFQDSFLMPDYDEFGISYKDRSALFNPDLTQKKANDRNFIFNHMVVVEGHICGTWERSLSNKKLKVKTKMFGKLSQPHQLKLTNAVKRYLAFIKENDPKAKK